MPKVSIIILTYDSADYINKLLESIERLHKDLKNIEIIVADNNSTDNTLEVLKKSKVEHHLREIPKNIGFAAGINAGVKNSTGDFLLFINPDTEFEDGSIWDMVKELENNKEIGIIGGKLINKNGDAEKSTGNFYTLFNTLLLAFGLDEAMGARKSPGKQTKVDFVSGGFMMIKSKLFKDLNGFDENYFMYVEDVDLCKRAKEKGIKTYFTPRISITHASHGSSSRSFAIEHIYKGLFYYHKKHSSKFTYQIVRFVLKLKAFTLFYTGRLVNNVDLRDTYRGALNV